MEKCTKYAIKCFKDEAQAILDLIPLLDDNFDKAIDLIYNCKGRFIITGVVSLDISERRLLQP